MKTLVVVDMQNDFITGSLGTKEAEGIVEKAVLKIREHQLAGWDILFTMDTHGDGYRQTQEGKKLPVDHCRKGTEGWELHPAIRELCKESSCRFEKGTFGSAMLGEELARRNPEEIQLIGLCTDICVISNAILLKAFLPETPIAVDASCCAGVTPESHRNALSAMKSCQISIINSSNEL